MGNGDWFGIIGFVAGMTALLLELAVVKTVEKYVNDLYEAFDEYVEEVKNIVMEEDYD